MTAPAVSVLLPVRDGEAHLEEALASLAAQTLDDFEVVAVDDGSTDATPEIFRSWAASDSRIRVERQERAGIVEALERARSRARGRYLARMDADDVAAPERLRRQLELMRRRPDVVLSGTLVRYFPRERLTDGGRRYERWINALREPGPIERDLFVECPIPHPTFFARTGAVAAVGGYRDRPVPEDYDLVLRLWEAGGRFAKVPEPLLRWRERPDRLSRTDPAYSRDAFRRLKVEVLRRTLLPGRDGAVVWGAGPTGKAFAVELRRQGVALRAFVDVDPRKVGQEIHGAPVVDPDGVDRFAGALVVAAVAQPGARGEIREGLRRSGRAELEDFVAVA